jgi:hypothetical protein
MASAPDPVVWTFQRLPEANALTDLNYGFGRHFHLAATAAPDRVGSKVSFRR